jgi:hypothetical protein
MLTPEQLAEIKARAEAASPGPWNAYAGEPDHVIQDVNCVVVAGNYDYEDGGIIAPEDTAFIIAARTDVPALLAENERLRELTETCTCYDGNPANYDGVHADCPVCGAIRAYHETRAELERLTARLKAAEDLCVMYSWSAAHAATKREKAAHELWRRWYGIVGSDFLTADAHPDLSDAMVDLLAAQRDETRARTLARIRSDAPTELPGGEG